jgi:hypothetical protein
LNKVIHVKLYLDFLIDFLIYTKELLKVLNLTSTLKNIIINELVGTRELKNCLDTVLAKWSHLSRTLG